MKVRNDMRERVAIKPATVTIDDRGGNTEAFSSTTATVWASVHAKSAGERTEGMQVEHTKSYEVVIRYRSDVAASARLTWGSKTLKVIGLRDAEHERKRFLILDCEEAPA